MKVEKSNCAKCGKEMGVKMFWWRSWLWGTRYVPAYYCSNKKCSEYKNPDEIKDLGFDE